VTRPDVAVIGGGTAGITAALAARHAGASVGLIEREPRLGGDCTFYGCVPSKTLLELARVAAHDSGDRTNAPLLCYLAGLARAGGADLDRLADAVARSTS
jgi:pyruvate/2-oxoglutarate dehydrogenase complex dihydrolipoamide dehydrogenase (E3) component